MSDPKKPADVPQAELYAEYDRLKKDPAANSDRLVELRKILTPRSSMESAAWAGLSGIQVVE